MAQHCQILVALLATSAVAQSGQAYNFWRNARGGVVRDTLYMDGGLYATIIPNTGGLYTPLPAGTISFNFSSKFDSTSNFTQMFWSTADLSNPSAMPHIGGAMFADDYEWYTFGGIAYEKNDNHTVLTDITRDALYIPNAAATSARLGTTPDYIPQRGNQSNLYITNGGGVSVPSESLGFYFSGLSAATNDTEMSFIASFGQPDYPSELVNTMLRVDTSQFGNSAWDQIPLPSGVAARAEAVLAWLPVGNRGAVVVMGGVPYPASLNASCNVQSYPQAANNSRAADFMDTVSVYDVASGAWYNQATNGNPPQLAQACAVVASSADSTVHNIYVYGGYDGVDGTSTNDDVWVLSIPSFTWVKVATGTASHGRYGHVCARPYPDQMMIVGGTAKCNSPLQTSQFADVFNLSSLSWTGAYNPSVWSQYVVPTTVMNAIKSSPTASMSPGLSGVITAAYAGTISTYYPYQPSSTNGPSTGPVAGPSHPKWVVPVVAVICSVAGIIILATIAFCVYKRKKSPSSTSARSRRSWIDMWRKHPETAQSVPDSEMTLATEAREPRPGTYEVDSYYKGGVRGMIAELTGTSSGLNSPEPSSVVHSPGFTSPSSPRSELHSPPVRHELPADLASISSSGNNIIKSHHMYPPNVDGAASSVGPTASISSPSSAPAMTPLELPQTRDDGEINNFNLNNSTTSTGKGVKSPRVKPAPIAEESDVSPNLTATDASPDQGPTKMPLTPPFQPIISDNNSSSHVRNTSSISSGIPDSSHFSPGEEQRRSMHIAALPDPPNTVSRPGARSSLAAEASSDGDPSPITPQRSPVIAMNPETYATATQQIRRKKLQNWAPGQQNDDNISAYTENNKNMTGKGDTL